MYLRIMHLLYLRDENYLIVSNDKIFDNIVMSGMHISNDEFLQICMSIKTVDERSNHDE